MEGEFGLREILGSPEDWPHARLKVGEHVGRLTRREGKEGPGKREETLVHGL